MIRQQNKQKKINTCMLLLQTEQSTDRKLINPYSLSYNATSNNRKLVHWLMMDGLLHLVQRRGAWAGCGPTQSPPQSPPRCTKCNSAPINGQ